MAKTKQTYNFSQPLVHAIRDREVLGIYIIARVLSYNKRGEFTIDDLINFRRDVWKQKSLHHGKGNYRTQTRKAIQNAIERRTDVFRTLPDGVYQLVGERHLIKNYETSHKKTKITIILKDISTRKRLTNTIIALASIGGKSYKQIASITEHSPETVRKANSESNKNSLLIKRNNFIQTEGYKKDSRDNQGKVSKGKARQESYKVTARHKINTAIVNLPIQDRKTGEYNQSESIVCFYAHNSYFPGRQRNGLRTPLSVMREASLYLGKAKEYRKVKVISAHKALYEFFDLSQEEYICRYGEL